MIRRHRIIRFEYQRPGKGASVFREHLVVDRPDVQVLLMDHEGREVQVDGRAVLDEGAPIVWFVFPGKWFSVGRFHHADGTFTGWYGNLCTPVAARDNTWSSTDLFLDLWTPALGPSQWLDETELAEAVDAGIIDHWTVAKIHREREHVNALIASAVWPPLVCRELDLATIRTQLQKNDDS